MSKALWILLVLGACSFAGATRGQPPAQLCDDQVTVSADLQGMHIEHGGALYNCCPDDAVFTMRLGPGNRIEVIEVVVVTEPCRCVCCTELTVDIGGLAGGTWELHFLWMDQDSSFWQEHVQEVVVPGAGSGTPFVFGSAHECGATVESVPLTWGAIKGVYR